MRNRCFKQICSRKKRSCSCNTLSNLQRVCLVSNPWVHSYVVSIDWPASTLHGLSIKRSSARKSALRKSDQTRLVRPAGAVLCCDMHALCNIDIVIAYLLPRTLDKTSVAVQIAILLQMFLGKKASLLTSCWRALVCWTVCACCLIFGSSSLM